MNENMPIVGYFIKYKTHFVCLDDGYKIEVQIIHQSKEYDFPILKKSLIGKVLIMSTSLNEVFYDYKVVSVRWLNDQNIEIYYDFRIKRFKGKECYLIQFSSKDIDTFGQNDAFLKSVYKSLTTKKLDLTKHDLTTTFEFLGRNYSLEICSGCLAPTEMSYNVSFSTFITIGSNDPIDINTIFELFKLIKKMISFLTYRGNIDFNFVDLYEKNNSIGTSNFLYGELHFSSKKPKHIFGNYVCNRMIKSDSVGSYMTQVIEMIGNGTISCEYIPNDSDSYNCVFINTTAWFQSFFREYARKESEYKVTGINVEKNGKRITFKEMINILKDYSKEYSEKAITSKLNFFSFFNDINEFKIHFADRIVKVRNDFCHGSVNYKKYKYFYLDLSILQITLYASILKFIGLDKENCNKALMQLFIS